MLHRKFELIPIKIRFFYEFLKLLQKPCTMYMYCLSAHEVCCLAHLACFVGDRVYHPSKVHCIYTIIHCVTFLKFLYNDRIIKSWLECT